jgi:hypothetical protein
LRLGSRLFCWGVGPAPTTAAVCASPASVGGGYMARQRCCCCCLLLLLLLLDCCWDTGLYLDTLYAVRSLCTAAGARHCTTCCLLPQGWGEAGSLCAQQLLCGHPGGLLLVWPPRTCIIMWRMLTTLTITCVTVISALCCPLGPWGTPWGNMARRIIPRSSKWHSTSVTAKPAAAQGSRHEVVINGSY